MSVIRNRHNAPRFTPLDNKTLWNKDLSLKAVGLWGRCISRPDNWEFSVRELEKSCKESEVAIYSAINELIKANLILRVKHYWTIRKTGMVHKGGGVVTYILFEVPATDEEKAKIEREVRAEYEQMLRDAGYEFYKPNPKKSSMNSKKYYRDPQNLDQAFLDQGNQDIQRTNVNKKEGTNKNEDVVVFSQKEKNLFDRLKKDHPEEYERAYEYMIAEGGDIDNQYGWLKKCLEGGWHLKAQKKGALREENKFFCQEVIRKYSPKLLPNSSFQMSEEEFIIIRGSKHFFYKLADSNAIPKIEQELKTMGLLNGDTRSTMD